MLLVALLLAAPLAPGAPALALRLETAYVDPGDSGARGGGGGISAGYRFTDQLSVVAGASRSRLWLLPPEGGPRQSRSLSMISAGLEALLDATPIAPFLELCVVRLLPERAAGYSLAIRTALGADWRLAPAFAVGLVVRTLTPLDGIGVTAVGGIEVAARFTWVPGATR